MKYSGDNKVKKLKNGVKILNTKVTSTFGQKRKPQVAGASVSKKDYIPSYGRKMNSFGGKGWGP